MDFSIQLVKYILILGEKKSNLFNFMKRLLLVTNISAKSLII